MVALVVATISLTGCDSDLVDTITDSVKRTEAGVTEPQGNQRDYLLENYDVKKAKDLKKAKLKKYDLSGPDYAGITEIVNDLDVTDGTEMSDTSTIEYCFSAYHCTGSSTTGRMCVSPSYAKNVLKAFEDTDFFKNGDYNLDSDANEFLNKLNAYVVSGSQVSLTARQELVGVLNRLTMSDLIRPANEVITKPNYKLETETISIVEATLSDKSIGFIDTFDNNTIYTRYNMPEYASLSGAKSHIIISFRENQKATADSNKDGWVVYYKSADDSNGTSMELATKISNALRTDSSLDEASSKIGNKKFDGCRSIDEYFENEYTFPIFNYTQIPTVLVVFNSGSSDNDNEKIGVCIANALGGTE